MTQNQHQKMSFCCALPHFMATYRNSLCCYCRLRSLYVLPQLKNHFVDSRHLCQGIKHHLTVWISFWGIQNRYKETDKDIACNMHRVAHNNSGSWRSSMKVAIQRDAGQRDWAAKDLELKKYYQITKIKDYMKHIIYAI